MAEAARTAPHRDLGRSARGRLAVVRTASRVRVPHLWLMGLVLLFATMFASVVVHGHLAAGQGELDALDSDIDAGLESRDRLRRDVSALESPTVIGQSAQDRGMVKAKPRAFLVPIGSRVVPGTSGRGRLAAPTPEEQLSEPLAEVLVPYRAPAAAAPGTGRANSEASSVVRNRAGRSQPAGQRATPGTVTGNGDQRRQAGRNQEVGQPVPTGPASAAGSTPVQVPTRTVEGRTRGAGGGDQQLSTPPADGGDQ